MRHRLLAASARALLFALLVGIGSAFAGIPPVTAAGEIPTLAPMLKEVTPAVVNISVLSRSEEYENPLLQDPFFRRFFDLPDQPRPQLSAGSGVIVDAAKGYVLTNHHVIKNAQDIVVTLKDRRRYHAKLLGSDAGTDIALLKIDAPHLTALPFGNSDALQVGDFVIAIGNPFGLGQTVTSGIVSALGRSGLNIEGYEDFIQTDAPINPGNSGGALVNLKGELVGINTAIIGPSGGNVGIGFAVPSNMARKVMMQLIRYGEVRRGWLGVSAEDLTPDIAQALKVKAAEGAVIVKVEPKSPAERAGLRVGDVILEVDGHPVRSSADLRNQLGLVPVGEEVALKLARDAKIQTIKARIGKVPTREVTGAEAIPQLAGATVGNIERGGKGGVAVVAVKEGSPAWYNGLRPGDVIAAVNRKAVHSVQELVAALKSSGRTLVINLLRGDFVLTIVISR